MNLKSVFSFVALLAFALGLTMEFPLGLPGQLTLGELLLAALVPISFVWVQRADDLLRSRVIWLVILLAILTLWQLLADTILGIKFEKTLDVTGSLTFTGLKLFVLAAMFIRFPHSVAPTLVGMAISDFVFWEDDGLSGDILRNEFWDVRVASWAAPLMIAVIIIGHKLPMIAVSSAVAIYGAAAAFFGARSHGLTMIVAIAIPYMILFAKNNGIGSGPRSILKVVAVTVVAGFAMSFVYVQAALQGLVTEKSQQQLKSVDNPYNPLELIWSGRAGTIIGFQAALENPLIGTGSMTFYPKNRIARYSRKDAFKIIHSIICETMVYGGMITLIPWIAFAYVVIQLYPPVGEDGNGVNRLNIVATINIVTLFWALFFSPLVSSRLIISVCVPILIYCNREVRQMNVASHRSTSQNAMTRFWSNPLITASPSDRR